MEGGGQHNLCSKLEVVLPGVLCNVSSEVCASYMMWYTGGIIRRPISTVMSLNSSHNVA